MTGFGRGEGVFEGKKITIDIKSLNSKSFDLSIKMPLRYKEKEFEIRKILNDRKERVMKEQKEAKESREQAIRFKDEYDTKLKRIDKEAEQILSDARKKAMQRENEIIADARAEAARIMENAKSEAELEKKRVKDEVKQEIISVAALMSEKIIAASVDEQTQNALFEQTLKEMGDKTWLNE